MPGNPQIQRSWLPDATKQEMDFLESSFFKTNGPNARLPTPTEVRALSPTYKKKPQPPPVKFEHLNLIVKFGPHVSIAEAQCLWLIRRVLPHEIPVPEVYGWRVDQRHVFIYMQLIRGETLKDRWNALSGSDKVAVCNQICQVVKSLRQVEQDPHDRFIGSINRGPLPDYVLEGEPRNHPFNTVKLFNDWFSWLPQKRLPDSLRYDDPNRPFLPNTGPIKLTHGDLHRANIIISPTHPPRVLAVIDWGQSGWYPDYWEYCKALYTSRIGEEWRDQWIPKFLSPRTDEHEVFAEYVHSIGGV